MAKCNNLPILITQKLTQKTLQGIKMKLIYLLLLLTASSIAHASTNESVIASNKKLVVDFYQQVLLQGDASVIDKYIGDVYIQHNPNLPNGKEALRGLINSFPVKKADDKPNGEIIRVIAEGDLVVLHVKNYSWPQPLGGAIIDIFRVENNNIVEHWDVVQAIPKQSANSNTMF